jgi:outer membrane protein assembly factor BamB
MRDDFVSRLGVEMREAADRDARRGPARRAANSARRRLRPQPVLAAAALVLAVVLGVAAARGLREDEAEPVGESPRVIARMELLSRGGTLATGFGAVWAADTGTNEILRVHPATRRVRVRIRVGVEPTVATAAGAVWAVAGGRLLRIDPATNRVTARIGLGVPPGTFALPFAAGRAVWVITSLELIRVAPGGNAIDRRIDISRDDFQTAGFAADEQAVYVQLRDGTLLTFDARTGARIARSRSSVDGGLAAAVDGTLYFATVNGLAAVEAATPRIIWTRDVGARGINAGVVGDGVVWLEGPDARTGRDRLWRLDARTGRVTGSVANPDFGAAGMTAVGRAVWSVGPSGNLIVVS